MSRRQLYDLGVTRWEIKAHVRAERWQTIGQQSVVLHSGPVSERGLRFAAVFQGGPRAQLDGVSSLIEGGLTRITIDRHRVSVPRGARVRRTGLFNIRQTRRWAADDQAAGSPPRTRNAVAAVRGALWARTDREAAFVLTLTVQQELATPTDLGLELLRIRRARRRLLLHAIVNDLLDGGRSLGEIDVVRELVRRGLPRPRQQVLRKGRGGRYYLDLYWPELGLIVEVDGIHHGWADNIVADALRQNALMLQADVVLRIPLLGLRLEPDAFYGQIAEAVTAAGRSRAA